MKRIVIISLIVLVGAALLIVPLLNKNGNNTVAVTKDPAVFAFKGPLAVVGDEEVNIGIEINSDDIQLLQLIYNDSVLNAWDNPKGQLSFKYALGKHGIGAKSLSLRSVLNSGKTVVESRITRVLSDITPERKKVRIMATLPHNDSNYVQGLEFYKGVLYEGTGDEGNRGATRLGKVDLTNGKYTQKVGLSRPYFGEGITILDGTLYQLTWRSGKCFVYDADELVIKSEFNYNGEGWGLCNDGTNLIMSDGTERITFRDPQTFQIVRTIEVYNNTMPITNLNELEYIDGKIYANIYLSDGVVVIDPATGKVLEEIDASELTRQVLPFLRNGEVLNGIAYNPESKKLYMTGKNWPNMFEVEFVSMD